MKPLHPRCPRCREPDVWASWADTQPHCRSCGLAFARHGWVPALWLNTWLTILVVMSWIVVALFLVAGWSDTLVVAVACVLAVVVPPAAYPAAKMATVRALLRLDPPSPQPASRAGRP